jgi:anionic cell wall polymer biosynthesis LytR-Cps2A-Psr (LCP) family protein
VVGDLVGIQPDYVFVTRFEKFQGLVNGIGGIDIHNPRFFADDPIKPKGFKAGRLHLTGYEAMAYSRIRHALPRGDFDRSAHQQVVVKAIQRKVSRNQARPGFIARGVLSAMRNLHTDLSPVQLFRLGHVLADVDPAKVTNCVVQGGIGDVAGQSVVLPFVAQAHQMGQDAQDDAVISKCLSPW